MENRIRINVSETQKGFLSLHLLSNMTVSSCKNRFEYAQLHLTLCDSMDCNPPGSSVHGIFLASLMSPAVAGGFFTTAPPGRSYLLLVQW